MAYGLSGLGALGGLQSCGRINDCATTFVGATFPFLGADYSLNRHLVPIGINQSSELTYVRHAVLQPPEIRFPLKITDTRSVVPLGELARNRSLKSYLVID
jgi:hypothetical protein